MPRKKGNAAYELKTPLQNDIITDAYVEELMNKQKRQKILSEHCFEIYQEKSGKWATYVPSIAKGRVLKRKNTREELEDDIVEYYMKYKNISIHQVFDMWVQEKYEYSEIQKQTLDRYNSDYERYFSGTLFDTLDIAEVTEEDIEKFIKTCIRDNQLTPKAYSGVRTMIRGIFKYAKKRKYTNISITNFFGDLELSRKIFRRKKKIDNEQVFTDKEVRMIKDYVFDHLTLKGLGVLLVFYTGLRVGELAALKRDDWHGNYLNVERTEIRYKGDDGKYEFEVRDNTKTEAGDRTIFLNSEAVNILKHIRLLNPFGEYLFETDGERIKAHNFANTIYRICERIDIKRRSIHKARKTFGTKLINADVDDRLVILQMGHTDISCTKNYYYYNNKEESEARQILEAAISY